MKNKHKIRAIILDALGTAGSAASGLFVLLVRQQHLDVAAKRAADDGVRNEVRGGRWSRRVHQSEKLSAGR